MCKWISVKDKLPPPWELNPHNSGVILTYRSGGVITTESFWFERERVMREAEERGEVWANPVTHWMPLPDPPLARKIGRPGPVKND